MVEALNRALSRQHLASDAAAGIWSAEIRNLLREWVERIVVNDEGIQIILKATAQQFAKTTGRDERAVQTILKAPLPDARPRARKEIQRQRPGQIQQPHDGAEGF